MCGQLTIVTVSCSHPLVVFLSVAVPLLDLTLQDVGALGSSGGSGAGASGPATATSDDGCLTPLGRHLAALPVEPRLGKLLVLGACLACLGPACTIAAAMSHKSPFSVAMERKAEAAAARKAFATPGKYGKV